MSTEVFASWFRDQLKRRGWHYPDFVAKSGVPYSTVYAWAVGTRRPDPASIDVIADVLGTDLDLVLNLAGHRPATEPIDLNDPKTELIGMLKRVRVDQSRTRTLRAILTDYLEADREARERER